MREINLDTYGLSLLTAKEDILNPRSSTNWALFAYNGIRLKLADSGAGGLKELMTKLHPRGSLYGMCRVGTNQSLVVMILWVGIEVDEYRRAECASHLPAIRAFFREVQIFLPAHTLDEMTEERMCAMASKAAMVMQRPRQRPGLRREDRQETVREEDERKKEEQQRAADERRQREIERLHQERREAMERTRKMMEREQKITEQRRIQVQMEAEERKQERIKWKHQEKEREDKEARARYLRSESEEKATEAAALVSQRTTNPREFFRQLSSSSIVNSDSQPSSPYPVRSPYRRLHRSQTDNIFIFNEPSSFTPPSPYRSRAASPYLPSTPTSKSPTLVFPCTPHSPGMVSSTISKQKIAQDCAMVPSRSQIYLPSPQQTESSYKVAAEAMPPSILQLQSKPSDSMNTEYEIKENITAVLDSLVFYPPPPTKEELRLDNRRLDEAKPADKLSTPPSQFEFSPKQSEDFSEASMHIQPDVNLYCQRVSDALTSSPSQSSPVSLVPLCLLPQPPSRPLPTLPISPRTLKDLESHRDFPASASVRSMVEEEEMEQQIEGEDREMVEKEWIHEESVREIREKVNEAVVEGIGGELTEDREEMNAGKEEPDRKNIEKNDSEKHDDGNILEETESEYIKDEKNIDKSETEKIQRGEIMKECENVNANKIVEESEIGKEQTETIMEDSESRKYQDGKIIAESEREKYKEEKIVEDANEKYQDKKIVPSENVQDHEERMMEESKSEKCQEEKITEESDMEKYQDDKIVEESEGEKYQEAKMLQEFECDKYEDEKIMEEADIEEYENEKIVEESENVKYQDEKMMEESQSEKYQDEKMMEESQSEKYQDEKIVEESQSEKYQDDKIVEKSDGEKYQVAKIIQEFECDKYVDEKIMEEADIEEYENEKIVEESQSEKYQDEKMMEESQSEKYQDEKMMEESQSEKYQDEKIEEESENVQEQDETIMEESESKKYQGDKIMEEFDGEKYQEVKILQEFECDKYEDETNLETSNKENYPEQKIEEEFKKIKDQDERIMEESESEKGQEEKVKNETEKVKDPELRTIEETESKKYQDEKTMEEFENEQKTVENCDSDGKDKDDFQEEYDEALMNQENEENPIKVFTITENLTVLKGESDTEIIMIHDTTDEEGVKRTSDLLNEKKERNVPFIETDEKVPSNADKQNEHEPCEVTLVSQHAPLLPESSAVRPGQFINLAESIPNHKENEQQIISTDSIQDKSDRSHQEDPKVTSDSLTAVSFSQESLHSPSKKSSGSKANALSAKSEHQASLGQCDGEEGLE
ncbi:Drebrin-like protein [Triplophysa tibetana]|uniref:Drebrin-like protein n=1 Tax=Triplophysa tibetana TaxID=1572043 RepID=A0A5A9PGM6_9TELE|nr:Drebrin-like protein [Triplophysa tibetana]